MSMHEGHRERMRQRAAQTHLKGFQPHEVLELMLMNVIPRLDVNRLAHELIEHFGSFSAVLDANVEELMSIKGIGERAAIFLTMQPDLFQYYKKDRWGKKVVLSTRKMAGEYCTTLFGRQIVESTYLLCLDAQKAVTANVLLNEGTLDEVVVYLRQVMDYALRYRAHSLILAHNHPSGNLEPSRNDIWLTEQLREALEPINIPLLDHIIVAGEQYQSVEQYMSSKISTLPQEMKQKAADRK